MENYELTAQQKLFAATGLKVGDYLENKRTGEKGYLYLSGIGYACVKIGQRSTIWNSEFVKVTGVS